jgi:hypothetical protein
MGMIRKVLGVDPGLASATAAVFGYDGRKNYPEVLGVFDVPTKGEDAAKRIDGRAFWRWIGTMDPDIAYIENANTMPAIPDKSGKRRGMGSASSGRYMRAAGALENTVDLAGIDIVMTQAATWKRALRLIGENKDQSIALAVELCPSARQWLPTKVRKGVTTDVQKFHNRAESILIALYGAIRCDLVNLRMAA